MISQIKDLNEKVIDELYGAKTRHWISYINDTKNKFHSLSFLNLFFNTPMSNFHEPPLDITHMIYNILK